MERKSSILSAGGTAATRNPRVYAPRDSTCDARRVRGPRARYRIRVGNPSGSGRCVPPEFGIRLPGERRKASTAVAVQAPGMLARGRRRWCPPGAGRRRKRTCHSVTSICAVSRLACVNGLHFTVIFQDHNWRSSNGTPLRSSYWQRVDIGKGRMSARDAMVRVRREIGRRGIPLDLGKSRRTIEG